MEFGLSVIAIYACGAFGIGIVALIYKVQTSQSKRKRVRRLRERLQTGI
jgi:hypothetical protein